MPSNCHNHNFNFLFLWFIEPELNVGPVIERWPIQPAPHLSPTGSWARWIDKLDAEKCTIKIMVSTLDIGHQAAKLASWTLGISSQGFLPLGHWRWCVVEVDYCWPPGSGCVLSLIFPRGFMSGCSEACGCLLTYWNPDPNVLRWFCLVGPSISFLLLSP